MKTSLRSISINFILSTSNKNDFNLNEITNILKLMPTRTRKWFDFPQASIDADIAETHWDYKIEQENCQEVSIPFKKMYDILYNKSDIINKIANSFELNIEFLVVIHAESERNIINEIPKEIISFLSSINASLTIDSYYYCQSK